MELELVLPGTARRPRLSAPRPARIVPAHVDKALSIKTGHLRQVARVCAAVSRRRRVRAREVVVRAGEALDQLIWVGSGLLMSSSSSGVAGVHMRGDIVGISALATGVHPFDIRALENGHIRQAPFALIEQLAEAEPQLLRALHRAMGAELLRQQRLATVLANPSAEGRLAAFLADLWLRQAYNKYRTEFVLLSVSRAEIGSYLGLTMESISRGFARLARRGLIDVRRRRLRIVDLDGLNTFAVEHRRANASQRGV